MKRRVVIVITALLIGLPAFEWFYQPAVPEGEAVAVLYGYSFFLKDSATAATYVERVLPYIRQSRLRAIVVSGGITRPTERPGESEAGLMANELRAHGVTVPIILEDQAHNTAQNAEFVRLLMQKNCIPVGSPVLLFSDRLHRWKARLASLQFLGNYRVYHLQVDMSAEQWRIFLNKRKPAKQ